jgi:fucose 4-O-acetylase-like acetyltransferase
MNMKYCQFDRPVVSLAVALAGVLAVVLVARAAARAPALNAALGYVGRKSITVMYVHGTIVFVLFRLGVGASSDPLRLAGGLAVLVLAGLSVSLLADSVFQRFAITRRLFLTG